MNHQNNGKGLGYYLTLTATDKSQPQPIKMTQFEKDFRAYLSAFDGEKKNFEEVEQLFDSLYSDSCHQICGNGDKIDRESLKRTHAYFLSKGAKATLQRFRRCGVNAYEVIITQTVNGPGNDSLFSGSRNRMYELQKRINVSDDGKIESIIDTSLASITTESHFFFLDEMRLSRHYSHVLSRAVQPDISHPSYNLTLATV